MRHCKCGLKLEPLEGKICSYCRDEQAQEESNRIVEAIKTPNGLKKFLKERHESTEGSYR